MNIGLVFLIMLYVVVSVVMFAIGTVTADQEKKELIMPLTILFPAFWIGRFISRCTDLIGWLADKINAMDFLEIICDWMTWKPFSKDKKNGS